MSAINWEEAIEQLEENPVSKTLEASTMFSRVHLDTVRMANQMVADQLGLEKSVILDELATFVSWDLKNNHPKVIIDFGDNFLESVWMG